MQFFRKYVFCDMIFREPLRNCLSFKKLVHEICQSDHIVHSALISPRKDRRAQYFNFVAIQYYLTLWRLTTYIYGVPHS